MSDFYVAAESHIVSEEQVFELETHWSETKRFDHYAKANPFLKCFLAYNMLTYQSVGCTFLPLSSLTFPCACSALSCSIPKWIAHPWRPRDHSSRMSLKEKDQDVINIYQNIQNTPKRSIRLLNFILKKSIAEKLIKTINIKTNKVFLYNLWQGDPSTWDHFVHKTSTLYPISCQVNVIVICKWAVAMVQGTWRQIGYLHILRSTNGAHAAIKC